MLRKPTGFHKTDFPRRIPECKGNPVFRGDTKINLGAFPTQHLSFVLPGYLEIRFTVLKYSVERITSRNYIMQRVHVLEPLPPRPGEYFSLVVITKPEILSYEKRQSRVRLKFLP